MTTVINIKDAPEGWMDNPDYVYIGRPSRTVPGPWGNPFIAPNESYRSNVINQYRYWLLERMSEEFRMQMTEALEGKILVCFCKPKACHGDVIVGYIDGEAVK